MSFNQQYITCNIIEGDFSNSKQQINKLYKYLTIKNYKVILINPELNSTFKKCIHTINTYLAERYPKELYKTPKHSLVRRKSKYEKVEEKTESEDTYDHSKIREPIIILIVNILGFKREVLNDMIHHLM